MAMGVFLFLLLMAYSKEKKKMKIKRVLVPYSTEKDKKKLESYIEKKTGRHVDLGDIHYGGKLTLQTMNIDLKHISSTNITCAHAFPGKHFKDVDEFIEWHEWIGKMHYPEAANEALDPLDVIALYYSKDKEDISYVCVTMFDRLSIEKYLVSSDGQALPFENNGIGYWLLISNVNGNMFMFRKTGDKDKPFTDIAPNDKDLSFFQYLVSVDSGI